MFNKKSLYKFITLIFITIIFIFALKINNGFKSWSYKNIYDNNISFAKINSWYKLKFGHPIPLGDFFSESIPVFNEKLQYSEINKYKDGIVLSVEYEYLVPSLDNGIVIFVGEKESYGNTIIVQQENGIDVWYSNLNEVNVSLYDYIKKGSLIGNVDNKLYLVFMKNGEIVDYKNYI